VSAYTGMVAKYLTSPWVWLAWAAASIGLTLPGLLWHLNYFATYGPRFRQLFPVLAILLAGACAAYVSLRARGLWRYEPIGLAGIALAGMAAYQPRATLITILFGTAQFALGRRTLRIFGFPFLGIAEEIALSSAAGIAETMGALFVLGLLRLYYPLVFLAMLALPCVVLFSEVKCLFALLYRAHQRWTSLTVMRSAPAGVPMFFSAIFLACSLVVILSPSLVFDALSYHLADARYFAESHALAPLRFQPNSYFPQGFEVLMAMAFALGGQPAAQMIGPLFFVLSLAAAFAVARRCGIDSQAALAGLAFVVATPFLLFEGAVVKNDFALAFFLLCALACCLRNEVHFSVVCLGSAFDIKHVALFGAIPLGIIYLSAIRSRPNRVRTAIALTALFLITGAYWQVRTFLLTGNPVYPLAANYTLTVRIARSRKTLTEKFIRWIQMPWDAQFDGTSHFESDSPSPLGALLVFSLPVWLITQRRNNRSLTVAAQKEERFRAATVRERLFAGLYFLYWSFELGILRFAIAPIVLLFLFLADRAARVYCASPRFTRVILTCCLFYCGVVSLLVVTLLQINVPELKIFARQLDWPGYLRVWSSAYPSLEYLRAQAQPGDLVLSVGNCAVAYAPEPARFHGICEETTPSLDAIRAELGREPYRFLVLPKRLALNPGTPPAFEDKYYAVYRLSQ
jgi:hypothetical protein